jgi:hypothetical protein
MFHSGRVSSRLLIYVRRQRDDDVLGVIWPYLKNSTFKIKMKNTALVVSFFI